MATGTLLPLPRQVALDATGVAISGGKLTFHEAGTSTLTTVYSDQALTVPLSNPVIADSAGRFAAIYLAPGTSVKVTFSDASNNVIWTQDNVAAVPAATVNIDVSGTAGHAISLNDVVYLSDGSGSLTAGSWYKADADEAYSSTTPVVGIAIAAIASGQVGTIRLGGRATGFSSLTVGGAYYVSGTAGALTLTAPSKTRLVGFADTTGSVVMAMNPAPGLDLLQIEALS